MKYIPLAFICLLATGACYKSNGLSGANDGDKLISIVSDSAGILHFGYRNHVITTLKQHMNDVDQDSGIINYTKTDSNEIVSIGFPQGNYTINYKLKSSKLPLLIYYTNPDTTYVHSPYMAEFFYIPGSDILDSVVYHYFYPVVFKFTYSGQNISRITEWKELPAEKLQIGTFDFTYDSTPNIFRQTDPLLYIYSYPASAFSQTMVMATFFAETFSGSTFNSVATSGITSNPWSQSPVTYTMTPNLITSTMTYSLNSHGKVTEEAFSNHIFEVLVGKKYVYE
ncbi:MAG: hypothetical protein ACTHK0_09545 [Ginsengibacter sp.]